MVFLWNERASLLPKTSEGDFVSDKNRVMQKEEVEKVDELRIRELREKIEAGAAQLDAGHGEEFDAEEIKAGILARGDAVKKQRDRDRMSALNKLSELTEEFVGYDELE